MTKEEANAMLKKHMYRRLSQEGQNELITGIVENLNPVMDDDIRSYYFLYMVEYIRNMRPIFSRMRDLVEKGSTYLEAFDMILMDDAMHEAEVDKIEDDRYICVTHEPSYCMDLDMYIYCNDIIDFMAKYIDAYKFNSWFMHKYMGYTLAEVRQYLADNLNRRVTTERVRQLARKAIRRIKYNRLIDPEDRRSRLK